MPITNPTVLEDTPTDGELSKAPTSNWAVDHQVATTGIHGAGANYIPVAPSASHLVRAFTKGWTSGKLLKGGGVNADPTEVTGTKITLGTLADNIFQNQTSVSTPFTAKINGTPTATSVPYDTDTGEYSISSSGALGKLVLYNTTRGNSRLIEGIDCTNNIITTQSSTDNWADNDNITTQSQTNTTAGYVDLDLSAVLATTVTGIFIGIFFKDTGAIGQLTRIHPYETYDIAKAIALWNKTITVFDTIVTPISIISQRITFLITTSGTNTSWLVLKYFGKFEEI